ncbi:Oxidoreductase domain protein [Candidatus Promineifilum breve]|uniref:Oxidoreductase domain protein n=1 Tax=Candidatus Promineifilum breve TaxID=1806508 RepID=A0A160T6X2_9CHLR|nr:Gfo/Idh/MocA family oxidoreductase [Candidatus Promineifilum breve]CUS05794.1 Oxidoreductase domain protein [Candidatus Promineifilum breve]
MDKVRWGLLSTAHINRRLIPAIRASARGELLAVGSRSQAAADTYAAEWGIPLAFGSYEALLASDAIDAVYIGLPNHLHAEWTTRALAAGKHVLCEKPFAQTLAEVDRMTAAARDNGRVLAEAFMYRHHPQTKIAGEFVRAGRLGRVQLLRGVFTFRMGSRDNVRLRPEWGGGSLWDVGIYPLSLAQFLLGGPPEWVFGDQWRGPSGVDEAFSGALHYAGGAMAQISSGFGVPYFNHFEALGDEGRLVFTRPFNSLERDDRRLTFIDAAEAAHELPVPEMELYAGEVADMHDAILDGRPSYISLSETRDHVRTVLALYESARRGERVYLEEIS